MSLKCTFAALALKSDLILPEKARGITIDAILLQEKFKQSSPIHKSRFYFWTKGRASQRGSSSVVWSVTISAPSSSRFPERPDQGMSISNLILILYSKSQLQKITLHILITWSSETMSSTLKYAESIVTRTRSIEAFHRVPPVHDLNIASKQQKLRKPTAATAHHIHAFNFLHYFDIIYLSLVSTVRKSTLSWCLSLVTMQLQLTRK